MFIVRRNLAAIEAGADPLHERGAARSPALPLSRSPALPLSRSPALPLSRSPALPLSRCAPVAEFMRSRAAARVERNSFRSGDQQVVNSVGNGLRAVPRSANRLRFPGHASAKARPRFTQSQAREQTCSLQLCLAKRPSPIAKARREQTCTSSRAVAESSHAYDLSSLQNAKGPPHD
jgi:hypothetical protein